MATSLNISLPKELRDFVVREVARGGYGSTSEYVREVLRETIARRAQEELERKLLEGLASPSIEMTRAEWKKLRAEVHSRIRERRRKS